MLKSVNTPMQITNNAACWVMMMMMDFLRCKKRRPKRFLQPAWVTKLIINGQDVAVRTSKKVEYTSSKLYENKGRAWRSHQIYHHNVQRDYFWFGCPCLYGVHRWTSKAVDHWPKNIWSKADRRYNKETRMEGTSKKYRDGWWHDEW